MQCLKCFAPWTPEVTNLKASKNSPWKRTYRYVALSCISHMLASFFWIATYLCANLFHCWSQRNHGLSSLTADLFWSYIPYAILWPFAWSFVCSLAAWWLSIPGGHSLCALCCATRLAGWGRSWMDLLAFDSGAKFSTLCLLLSSLVLCQEAAAQAIAETYGAECDRWQRSRDTTETGLPQLLYLPAGWSSSWPRQMQKLRK